MSTRNFLGKHLKQKILILKDERINNKLPDQWDSARRAVFCGVALTGSGHGRLFGLCAGDGVPDVEEGAPTLSAWPRLPAR